MSLAYGIGGLISVPPPALRGNGAPPANFKGQIGQMYFDISQSPADVYIYNGTSWQTSTSELISLTTDDATVVEPVSGNINLAGVAPLETTGAGDTASIELTGIVDVANGGTGAASLTDHGVLVGSGTGAVTPLAVGTTGQVLLGATGADPAWTSDPSIAGSVTAATTITATLGDITTTDGNFVATAEGTGILLNSAQASGASPQVVNGRSGRATFTGVSIAADADQTFTITNSAITAATTEVMLSMSGATSGSALSIKSKTASAGSLAIVVTNGTGATTTVADIQFDFLVLNA